MRPEASVNEVNYMLLQLLIWHTCWLVGVGIYISALPLLHTLRWLPTCWVGLCIAESFKVRDAVRAAAAAADLAPAALVVICTSALSSPVHILRWLLPDDFCSGCVHCRQSWVSWQRYCAWVTIWLWAQ